MTRVVVTGRRMKSSATFMALFPFSSRVALLGPGFGLIQNYSAAARAFSGYEAQLPVGDYLLSGREAFRDNGQAIGGAIHVHVALLHRHVRLDHEHILALLSILHCL